MWRSNKQESWFVLYVDYTLKMFVRLDRTWKSKLLTPAKPWSQVCQNDQFWSCQHWTISIGCQSVSGHNVKLLIWTSSLGLFGIRVSAGYFLPVWTQAREWNLSLEFLLQVPLPFKVRDMTVWERSSFMAMFPNFSLGKSNRSIWNDGHCCHLGTRQSLPSSVDRCVWAWWNFLDFMLIFYF